MKTTLTLLIIVTTSLPLSSCMLFTNQQTVKACNHAPYVYSNLANTTTKVRRYHLPNGVTCPAAKVIS